ncbi:MAG: response regulator [Isosphaeraceae bacterium]|nr:response regulator [Isosphaeraceae bacterium]
MSDVKKVLIVEDEPNVRLVFRTALESAQFDLNAVDSGEAGLNALQTFAADLVLLDLRLPGITGMEFLKQLRGAANNVPVIIITAYGTVPDAVEAMKLGALDFLAKPLTPEALRGKVTEVLARHQPAQAPSVTPKPVPPPDPTAALLVEAKRALNQREFDRADNVLKQVIERRPKAAEAHYLVGVLHELRGERHSAYGSYRAALNADPNYEPAKLHLVKYFDDRMM